MSIDFVKMEGLGNDFVVVGAEVEPSAADVVAWCDRRFGIGADGVLRVVPIASDRIRMIYWNADGNEAEMCGNGLRCVAALALQRGWVATPDIVVETASGPLPAQVRPDGLVRALVGRPRSTGDPVELEGLTFERVDVGNPHAVAFVDGFDRLDVAAIGARVEADDLFPNRTNVEFVQSAGRHELEMRVWERGVGETMASGTGSTAAAYAAILTARAESPVDVRVPGGVLTIEMVGDEAWMIGPGTEVYVGTLG